jgi:hypothetical protein
MSERGRPVNYVLRNDRRDQNPMKHVNTLCENAEFLIVTAGYLVTSWL